MMIDLQLVLSIAIFSAILLVLFCTILAIITISERPITFNHQTQRTKLLPHHPRVLITGGNRGIGFESARKLAKLGCRVVICSRDVKRGKTAVDSIKRENPDADVQAVPLDLSSLASVRECVETLQSSGSFDILVNNAGAMLAPSRSADGFDTQYQTNYLGHFALTKWMMERNLLSANARIVNVGSVMYLFASSRLEKITSTGSLSRLFQYCSTKLLTVLFTLEFKRRYPSSTVHSLCVHPGIVATDFVDHFIPKWLRIVVTPLLNSFQMTADDSAEAIVNACLSKSLDGRSGVYLNLCDERAPNRTARSEELARTLWELSSRQIQQQHHE